MRTFVPDQDVFEAVEDAFRDMWVRPRDTFERFVGITGRERVEACGLRVTGGSGLRVHLNGVHVQVHDPGFGNTGLRIERELVVPVVDQGGGGNLNDEQHVLGNGRS